MLGWSSRAEEGVCFTRSRTGTIDLLDDRGIQSWTSTSAHAKHEVKGNKLTKGVLRVPIAIILVVVISISCVGGIAPVLVIAIVVIAAFQTVAAKFGVLSEE